MLYTSEINFLTGFAEICLFEDFSDNTHSSARILWGARMILLALLFGLWATGGFGTACIVLLIVSLVFYSISARLGQTYGKEVADGNRVEQYELCYYLACISVVNWIFAIPFAAGPGTHTERSVWLVVNFVTFAILAGVYFTDTPMKSAWGCYPPSVAWNDIGANGICPQNPKGSYLTCTKKPVKSSAFLACQHFSWVESLGMDSVRIAFLIAAVSIGVYLATIPRNFRR